VYLICSTLCFVQEPLATALERIVELEFSGIELGLIDAGQQIRLGEALREPQSLLATLRHGPAVPVLSVYADFPPQQSRALEEDFRRLCHLAHSLKATCLTIPASPRETPLDLEIERLHRYVWIAAQEGLTLCVENQVGGLAELPSQAVQLCRAVRDLGLTLDPAHYVSGPHRNQGYEAIYPYVQHVQLRDADLGPANNQLPVGQGRIDYSKILGYLERHDYQRALAIEYRNEPPLPFDTFTEVRKLKLLLESLL
jgi:sugar phosphate isomerase/epimerase